MKTSSGQLPRILEGADALLRGDDDDGLDLRAVVADLLSHEMRLGRRLLLIPSASEELFGLPLEHIMWPVPLGLQQRADVLRICGGRLEMEEVSWLASLTNGFLPCDLEALCRGAALKAIAAGEKLSKEHFRTALASVQPTALRSSSARGHEVSGLDAVVGQSVPWS